MGGLFRLYRSGEGVRMELYSMVKGKIYLDEDTRLMLKTSKGEREAYERLYKKYFPVVVDYLVSLNAYRALVKDVAQEVFTRLWQHRTRYRPESSFKTYLFGCVRNVLSERQKQSARDRMIIQRLIFQNWNNHPSFSDNPEFKASQAELIKNAIQAISMLPPKQKEALKLFYITGSSITESAKQVKCTVTAFEGRLFRARERLSQLLQAVEQ
jgi:RNA polymerase sigma-70 factor (ECF subfamily)